MSAATLISRDADLGISTRYASLARATWCSSLAAITVTMDQPRSSGHTVSSSGTNPRYICGRS